MEVEITHHVDEGEGGSSGPFRYEYDRFEFRFDERIIWARRYSYEAQNCISIVGCLDKVGRPISTFYDEADLGAHVVAELKRRGFETISVLTEDGYTPLDVSFLKAMR